MAATTPTTFPHFPDLPLDIQLEIWDLVLQDFTFVRITNWEEERSADGLGLPPPPHPNASKTTRTETTTWPILPLPALTPGDPPGLIPHHPRFTAAGLPIPSTLASHPPPYGIQASRARPGPKWEAYMQAMLTTSRKLVPYAAPGVAWHLENAWARMAPEWRGGRGNFRFARKGDNGADVPELLERADDAVACFAVCRVSRSVAMRRAVVVDAGNTGRSSLALGRNHQPEDGGEEERARNRGGGDDNDECVRLVPVRNGVVFENAFRDHRYRPGRSGSGTGAGSGRPCFVYAIAPNTIDQTQPPVLGRDFLGSWTNPANFSRGGSGGNVVAARLADIERCIFDGQRLSLTRCPPGLNQERFKELQSTMWWQPEAGSRARRPEANHPLHCPPRSILWIYSTILHHVALQEAEMNHKQQGKDWDDDTISDRDAILLRSLRACMGTGLGIHGHYALGIWYFHLLQMGGRCPLCHVRLVEPFRRRYPGMLDEEGCVDIVVLRDRDSVERPEATLVRRSHEMFSTRDGARYWD